MMIRKIVLLILVLGFMTQGVSAETWVVSTTMAGGYYNGTMGVTKSDTFTVPVGFANTPGYVYIVGSSSCISGCYYDGGAQLAEVGIKGWVTNLNVSATDSINLRTPSTGELFISKDVNINHLSAQSVITTQVHRSATAGLHVEMGRAGATVVLSTESPNVASGQSCTLSGTYDIYMNGNYSYSDSDGGNYSFNIFDGVEYKIYYSEGDEWHNFTASGDEEWNPTDTCNNADFNFTNLSYTSPVKQYLTSTVTVDINDTDGTISSAIARIDGSNYSMQFIGGEKWRYLFTGTNIIKNYYITNIYATDNEGGQDSKSYNASYIHVESRTGGGGGGGGGSYPPDPTIPPSEPCTLNCDIDGDGTCDLNCDDNDDGTCDRNCDTDDDGTCDLNCDDNDDGTCDRNCDDNNDGTCDRNCDTDGDGYCDVNCDDSANRPRDEDIPDDFKDLFENFRDGDIPDDFWTDKNLRIHPASLNSTAFYTGWDKPQNITYRFLTNKFIDTCEVTDGTCTIDQRFLVNFNTVIDENTTEYRGTLTVSRTGETAIADIYINVINLCACKEITPWQLNISDEWAQRLVYFVRVKDGAIVCIRLLFLILLLAALLGIVFWDSTRKH